MSDATMHAPIEALLPAAALEILDGEDLALVTAHLAECPECRGLLQSYRDVVAGMTTALPEQPFHPSRATRVRTRLLARVGRVPKSHLPRISRLSRR